MQNFNKIYNNVIEELFDKDVPEVSGKKIYQSLFHNKPGEDYDGDYSYEEEVSTEDVSYILSFMPIVTQTENVKGMQEKKNIKEFIQIDIEFKLKDIYNEEKAKEKRYGVAYSVAEGLIEDAQSLHDEIMKNPSAAEWEIVQNGLYLYRFVELEELAAVFRKIVESPKQINKSPEIYELLKDFTPSKEFIDDVLVNLDYSVYQSSSGSQSYYKNISTPKSLIKLFAVIRKRLKDLLIYANWTTLHKDQNSYILAISFSGNNKDESRVSLYNKLTLAFVNDLNRDEKTLPPHNFNKWVANIDSGSYTTYYNIFAS